MKNEETNNKGRDWTTSGGIISENEEIVEEVICPQKLLQTTVPKQRGVLHKQRVLKQQLFK